MLSHGSINTDVGLHSECLPQISRHPPLKCKPLVLVTKLSDQNNVMLYRQKMEMSKNFLNIFLCINIKLIRSAMDTASLDKITSHPIFAFDQLALYKLTQNGEI